MISFKHFVGRLIKICNFIVLKIRYFFFVLKEIQASGVIVVLMIDDDNDRSYDNDHVTVSYVIRS